VVRVRVRVDLPLARRRESEHSRLGVLAEDEGEPALQLVRDLLGLG